MLTTCVFGVWDDQEEVVHEGMKTNKKLTNKLRFHEWKQSWTSKLGDRIAKSLVAEGRRSRSPELLEL